MQRDNAQIVTFLIATIFLITLLLGIIVTILYLYQKKRVFFHQHFSNAQIEIQEETFQNISREIHDNIGLSLTLAKLYLNTLNIENTQKPFSAIEASIELISQAINDLSDISKNLNSEAICRQGFLNVVEMKLDKINKSGKFITSIEIKGTPVYIDSHKELILYRITQEALNNIIKHSEASSIAIQLDYNETQLHLIIKDDGIGINWKDLENKNPGKLMTGLTNIKTRTKLINGTCNITSDSSGTIIYITVPTT